MPLVVVIEDDPASQVTLSRVLRAGGYEAAVYGSAEDYLSSPPSSLPIGMVLDVHLGPMSGIDLQRQLRTEGSAPNRSDQTRWLSTAVRVAPGR